MKKNLLLLLLILSATTSLKAQRVGLVLSGGGAKGLYHVGMIKALEDNNIPIDYISGASMGAIVGALYSTGWSPDEMLHFFATDSVRTWLKGQIPEEYNYYFKRFSPTPKIVSLKLNAGGTKLANALALPTNLISTYPIDLAFINMMTGASSAAGDNFDSLMVPFRCNASDIYNKKSVTFRDGSLAFAVRASMSIPLAFTPMVRDSLLLYDGGVYNNFPWQDLESDFKPDIYIGGICAGNYDNPPDDDVIKQVSVMITKHTDYTLRDSTDILIARRFPEIETLDYERAAYIMAMGYQDAMKQMPEIQSKITRRVSTEEIAAKRQAFRSKVKPLIYSEITVSGLTKEQTAYVNRQIWRREPGQLTSMSRFEDKYLRMLSSDVFSAKFPDVTYDSVSGYHHMNIDMQTQPSAKISLGGNISSSTLNQLYMGFQFSRVRRNVSTYQLNAHLGLFYNAVDIGGRHDIYTRFPFYIDYYVGFNSFDYNTKNSDAYNKNQAWRSTKHNVYYGGGSIAVPYLDNSAARLILVGGKMNDEYFQSYYTSNDNPCRSDYTYASATAEVQSQTFNYNLFPSRGRNELFQVSYTIGIEDYTHGTLPIDARNVRDNNRNWIKASYKREQYLPLRYWFTLGYHAEVVLSNHPDFLTTIATAITAPAFSPTPLSKTLFMPQYRSSSYLGVGLMPVASLTKDRRLYIKGYLYGFVPHDFRFLDQLEMPTARSIVDSYRLIFGGSFVYQTAIGPASLTAEKYTTGSQNWNISLNLGYHLFSTKKH